MADNLPDPESLIDLAKGGNRAAMDQLLELYRNYLSMIARTQLDGPMHRRADTSDLVQETLLRAYEAFDQFRGRTESQLIGWLRAILVRNLTDYVRQHRAQKRDVSRDIPLDVALTRSSINIDRALAAISGNPASGAVRRERSVLLADALARLPADYREVILLRQFRGIDFSEIADEFGRSTDAVRKLWVRALRRLREELATD